MNLLIVNDEVLTAETMKEDMDWSAYGIDKVYTAYDAEGGKKCINEHPIDIMLCDIEMPGENGIALLRWVRENKKEIECIFLTCHASFQYAQEAITLGCQNYLLIPAKYEEIGAEIRKVAEYLKEKRKNRTYLEFGKQAVREKVDHATENCMEKKSTEEVVADTVSYIMENLGSHTLSVNEIAEKFYLHPVYLNRIFRKEKDISIGKYIIGERMKLAAELLKSGRMSANAIAEQVGYTSYSNFHMMFKKYFDCTPIQYVEKEKGAR